MSPLARLVSLAPQLRMVSRCRQKIDRQNPHFCRLAAPTRYRDNRGQPMSGKTAARAALTAALVSMALASCGGSDNSAKSWAVSD